MSVPPESPAPSRTPTAGPPTVALTTTKRKFHQLLDNLTANRSTTSLASTLRSANASTTSLPALTGGAIEPSPKRLRASPAAAASTMDRPRTVSGERVKALKEKLLAGRSNNEPGKSALSSPPSAVSRLADGKLLIQKAGTTNNKDATATSPAALTLPRKTPNYAPYNQDQFLARLKTFSDLTKWKSKPEEIEDLQWAKRGWSCVEWNVVGCKGGCEKRVVVQLMPKQKDEEGNELEFTEDHEVGIQEGLVERYRELIVEGHDEGCLWRKAGCKDDIYHLPIANRARSETEFLNRYTSLLAIESALPPLENIKLPPEPPISEIVSRLPSKLFQQTPNSAESTDPPSTLCITFAMFGWTGEKQGGVHLAACDHCFMRLPLWMYTTEKIAESSRELDVDPAHIRLDILGSHRLHCPWVNGVTQANPKTGVLNGKAGYETLQFILLGSGGSRKQEAAAAAAKGVDDDVRSVYQEDGIGGGIGIGIGTESPDVARARRSLEEQETERITGRWAKLKRKLKNSTAVVKKKSLSNIKFSGSGRKDDGMGKSSVLSSGSSGKVVAREQRVDAP